MKERKEFSQRDWFAVHVAVRWTVAANLEHELTRRLAEAIEFAAEGWSYANDYFKTKHEYEKRLARLQKSEV